jgi:hypothetical protein
MTYVIIDQIIVVQQPGATFEFFIEDYSACRNFLLAKKEDHDGGNRQSYIDL